MRVATFDSGLRFGDPNLRWGDPSFVLEPGDPGYVPSPSGDPDSPITSTHHRKTKTNHRMAHKNYLPEDERGIHDVLVSLDSNLPGPLATKFDIDAATLLRLRHGRYAWGWFIDALPIIRAWPVVVAQTRDRMQGDPGPLEDLPSFPVLPPAPTFNTPAVTTKLEPGFFDFLSRLVQMIKTHDNYDPADGVLLGIVGSVIQPPDPQIIPVVKWKFTALGRPIISVKKLPFQGYTVWAGKGNGQLFEIGFSSSRDFELDHSTLLLPAAAVIETWKVQVQYRYKNKPFGQRSAIVEIPVRGQ